MNTPYRPSNQGNIFKYGTKFFRGYYSCDAWTGKVTFSKLQSPTKVLAHLSTLAVFVREIYHFAPSPRFNVVCRDESRRAKDFCRGLHTRQIGVNVIVYVLILFHGRNVLCPLSCLFCSARLSLVFFSLGRLFSFRQLN